MVCLFFFIFTNLAIDNSKILLLIHNQENMQHSLEKHVTLQVQHLYKVIQCLLFVLIHVIHQQNQNICRQELIKQAKGILDKYAYKNENQSLQTCLKS